MGGGASLTSLHEERRLVVVVFAPRDVASMMKATQNLSQR